MSVNVINNLRFMLGRIKIIYNNQLILFFSLQCKKIINVFKIQILL